MQSSLYALVCRFRVYAVCHVTPATDQCFSTSRLYPSAVVTGVGTHTADCIVNLTVCSISARPRLNADRVPRPRLQDDLAAAKEALTTKPLQDLLGCAELNGK